MKEDSASSMGGSGGTGCVVYWGRIQGPTGEDPWVQQGRIHGSNRGGSMGPTGEDPWVQGLVGDDPGSGQGSTGSATGLGQFYWMDPRAC